MSTFKFKLTTQVQLEVLESNARTFGELKQDIINSPLGEKISFDRQKEVRDGIEWVKTIKFVEKNTLAEYGDINEANLPAGESFIFFVVPIEHKGGLLCSPAELHDYSDYETVVDEIYEWGYNDLRSLGSQINRDYNTNIDLSGKRDDILCNLKIYFENYFENSDWDEEENEILPQNVSGIDLAKSYLRTGIEYLTEAAAIIESFEYLDIVDGVTASELHEKALKLQRELNS